MDTMTCPHCGQELQITPELRGVRVECPGCARQFTVPTEGQQPRTTLTAESSSIQTDTQRNVYEEPAEQAQPQAGWAAAPYGPTKVTAPGAVAALVFGILSFIICGLIFGLLAIAKGKQARDLCRERPDLYTGAGMALAGSILGWTAFTLNLVFLLIPIIWRMLSAA